MELHYCYITTFLSCNNTSYIVHKKVSTCTTDFTILAKILIRALGSNNHENVGRYKEHKQFYTC